MSRVGKAPIALPKGAEVNFAGGLLTVKGPLGTLSQPIHQLVKVNTDNGTIDRKSTRLNSSHRTVSRMPSHASKKKHV